MSENAREAILAAAKTAAQLHGYDGINFRSIAEKVGIKNASIYYHFPSKADLGAAVAERYWQQTLAVLEDMRAANPDPQQCLQLYPSIFRKSLEDGNKLCLSSFLAAQYQDVPEPISREVKAFADVNITWLAQVLVQAGSGDAQHAERHARAIYSAVAGAQLIARAQANIALFDELMLSYCEAGLIPA